VSVIVSCGNPPVELAFEALVRQGDKEWAMGTAAFHVGASASWQTGASLPGVQGNVVDVILRPSVRAAEREVDCTELWDGEVVFRGVQVKGLNAPATQPAR
jgi:hypothetical protein